eukprot:gene6369-16281_t
MGWQWLTFTMLGMHVYLCSAHVRWEFPKDRSLHDFTDSVRQDPTCKPTSEGAKLSVLRSGVELTLQFRIAYVHGNEYSIRLF